jgi:hypothetical protein
VVAQRTSKGRAMGKLVTPECALLAAEEQLLGGEDPGPSLGAGVVMGIGE